MHDPKLSAAVAHRPLLLPESILDKLPGSLDFRHRGHISSDYLDQIHPRHTKTLALPRSSFSTNSASYPEDFLDLRSQGRILPFFHRLKDAATPVEMLRYLGYESALSEMMSQYRAPEQHYGRSLYDSLREQSSMPLTVSALSRRLAANSEYIFPIRSSTPRSRIVIEDVTGAPSSSSAMKPTSSSPTRAADTLSLSPLHVSTTVSISPLSSESSPSSLRRSSVSPDSRWTETRHHHHHQHRAAARPELLSTLSVPNDFAQYEERHLRGDRPVPFPFAFPQTLWPPSASVSLYDQGPPPLLYVYNALPNPSCNVLDNYISTSSSHHVHQHHHQHRHRFVRDSFYGTADPNSSLDSRSSPGKELPTKTLKQDRVRDRQELSGALDADKKHLDRLCSVKKSASTQTQFSSFVCENLPPPPYYAPHDTIIHDKLHASSAPGHAYPSHLPPSFLQYPHALPSYHSPANPSSLHSSIPPPTHHQVPHSSPVSQTSPPIPSRHAHAFTSPSSPATPTLPPPSLTQLRKCSPPAFQSLPPYSNSPQSCSPPPHYASLTRGLVDVQHAPLNLSHSTSSVTPSCYPPMATSGSTTSQAGSSDGEEWANQRQSNKNGSNLETASQVSDEAIEEHFRRSLGKCYNEPASPKKVSVHVSEKICSVDDHFARALGDQMWTEIKARTEAPPLDPQSVSVDAHFAKALGATMWMKLKAENKLAGDLPSTQPMHPKQQMTTKQPEDPSNQQKSPSTLQTSLVT